MPSAHGLQAGLSPDLGSMYAGAGPVVACDNARVTSSLLATTGVYTEAISCSLPAYVPAAAYTV